jgi:hypothetical protein
MVDTPVITETCEKHGTEGAMCDLCILESLSRQQRAYTQEYFPALPVTPPVEFKSIQRIMARGGF